MKKELALSHSIIPFENLNELLATMDEFIELHSKMSERYGDRLGYLLRHSGASGDAAMQTSEQPIERRRQSEDGGWTVLGTDEYSLKVANGVRLSSSSAEVAVLFKIVESVKAKTAALEVARKLISELPSQGFRADSKLLVVFKDGIPKQVIPTNEVGAQQAKFRYIEQFQMAVLK